MVSQGNTFLRHPPFPQSATPTYTIYLNVEPVHSHPDILLEENQV